MFYGTCNDISVTCDGTDVQADRRSCSYGRAPNAIDISQGFLKMTVNCSVHARTPGSVQEPEVRPGAREESASPAWLATPAIDAHNPANIYV